LQHVLGISGTAGDPLSSSKNAGVVGLEECFKLSRRFGFH
jgi:hypothetical protein